MDYRSRLEVLGLPLFHFATSSITGGQFQRGVATGWIAIGDIAFGALFACGGVAIGAVAVGGASLGLLPIGGLALGVLAVGGIAVGVVAVGGAAVAWYASVGGVAVARTHAIGGLAMAPNVIAPPSRDALPLSAIPHAPFAWSDAVILVLLAGVILALARFIRRRREERYGERRQ